MSTKHGITVKQLFWLETRGDRNTGDVEEDEKGLYVQMGSGRGPNGYMKVYLPDDSSLNDIFL